jgi:hypothetical protein
MKNVHVLSTDKPSRLHTYKGVLNLAAGEFVAPTIVKNDLINLNIYITSDDEIKDVRPHKSKWQLEQEQILNKFPTYLTDLSECKLVIMTTDQELINDGVQAIDDEFLEFFVKNPSCESVKWNAYPISPNGNIVATNRPYPFEGLISNFKIEYKIIIPNLEIPEFGTKEFNDLASGLFGGKPKQEKLTYTESAKKEERISNCTMMKRKQKTVEEAAEYHVKMQYPMGVEKEYPINDFIQGAKWMKERMYSEEEVINAFNEGQALNVRGKLIQGKEWFDQFKKK